VMPLCLAAITLGGASQITARIRQFRELANCGLE
jgi:hypothetical protein